MSALVGLVLAANMYGAQEDWRYEAPKVLEVPRNTYIYPTIPGTTIRDYRQPGFVIDQQGLVRPTIPGTTIPDLRSPSYIIERR